MILFGLKSSDNKAIVELFDKGLINCRTLRSNMPGFDEAVELIHNRTLDKKIGIHLVLTDGLLLTQEIKSINLFFK